MSGNFGPGDLVYDETEEQYYAIKRVESQEIYLLDPNIDDSEVVMVLQEDVLYPDGRWVIKEHPDHNILFQEAPGKTFNESSIIENTCHKFLLIISKDRGTQDVDFFYGKDNTAAFDTKKDAIEYFASMLRIILEGKILIFRDYYSGFDRNLSELLCSLIDSSDNRPLSPPEISEIIMSYTIELENDDGIIIEKWNEQTQQQTKDYFNIIKIPYFTNSHMTKSSMKR